MRYATVFKFIAVILCAATLLGAVGSAAGILFLTELGGKSINEHYVEQLRSQSIGYAMNAGGVFASEELGGTPRNIINQYWGNAWEDNFFDWTRVGYTLYDSEGNALQEQEMPDSRDVVFKEKVIVSGRYMQLINVTPYEEAFPQATEPVMVEDTLVTVMPSQESTAVHAVIADYTDGHREEWPYDGTQLGSLEYSGGNTVTFISNIGELPMGDGWYPNHILFGDNGGNIVYEAYDNTMVILGSSNDNGYIEWLLPATAVTTAAPVGVTFTEGDYTSYDAIPTQGVTVSTMNVAYANAQGETVGSEGIASPDLLGTIFHDYQGNAEFHSTEPMTMDIPDDCIITSITFGDAEHNCIFEANCPGGVGTLTNDEHGYLVFRGQMPGTELPEETVPEETVPEETVPEETVPEETMPEEPIEVAATEAAEAVEAVEGLMAFAMEKLNIYSAPSARSELVGTVEAWQQIEIIQQQNFNGESWGLIPGGWILMDRVMVEESIASAAMNVTTAETDIPVYSAPFQGDVIGTIMTGVEYEIREKKEVDGKLWGATAAGWVLMETDPMAREAAAEAAAVPATAAEKIPAEPELPAATEPEVTAAPEQTDSAAEPEEATEPSAVTEATAEPEAATEALAEETLPTEPAPVPEGDIETAVYYDSEQQQTMVAEFVMVPIPEGWTMEIRLASGALRNELAWTLLRVADAFRSILMEVLGVCIVVFVLCVVYICCAAARKRGSDEVKAGGLNRIPLDLYAVLGTAAVSGLAIAAVEGSQYLARNDEQLAIIVFGACAYLICQLLVGFFFAFVAQIKTPGGYWWRNTVCGWGVKLMILGCTGALDLCIRLWRKGGPPAVKLCQWLWKCAKALWVMTKTAALQLWDVTKTGALRLWDVTKRLTAWSADMFGKCFSWTTAKLARFFGMLPITWQFLGTGFVLVFLLYIMIRTYKVGYILLGFGIFFAVILYAASAFAILLESAKKMSKGDLDTKVDDRMLIGGFKNFAGELNDLADVAVVAAQKQLKSERMKTELITNVSHDIKTPLTSIINYVDLLRKPHTEQQQEQYLEVLERQSQRLKKLIDDLMEMSKASTGNLAVDIEQVDAAEAVNQALGEFADKLERAQLMPVFRQPDDPVYMMADGRLVWRVMSNLLGNAVKYALPGTRVYLDLLEMDGKVIISMKNISREELNVNADELLERFVRGDASRNTEGSGLGLNIAQSLMELQKGQLQILVDGDLFKVTLIFPGA